MNDGFSTGFTTAKCQSFSCRLSKSCFAQQHLFMPQLGTTIMVRPPHLEIRKMQNPESISPPKSALHSPHGGLEINRVKFCD
jgi:hypothetical protein